MNKQTSPSTELDPRSHAEGERPPAPPESHVGASPSTAPAQADKARTERENQKAESRFQDDGGPSIHKNTQVETKPASQKHAISPLPGDEAVNEEDLGTDDEDVDHPNQRLASSSEVDADQTHSAP